MKRGRNLYNIQEADVSFQDNILDKQWYLSLDIKPTGLVEGREIDGNDHTDGYSNVLHVGKNVGKNWGPDKRAVYGDRSPGIWFSKMGTRLHIPSAINGNNNYHDYGDTPAIPMGEWTNVQVSQLQLSDGSYQFTIRVAGTIFHQMINNNPMEFEDVNVWAGNGWYKSALARIDNFVMKSFPNDATDVPSYEPVCDIKVQTDNRYNYQKVIEWPENFASVWFSVVATNDICIALSKTDRTTTESVKIILGAGQARKTVIRSSHEGGNLATVYHTVDQFDQVPNKPTSQHVQSITF